MINKELIKREELVEKFDEIVEREVDNNLADIESMLEDYVKDMVFDMLDKELVITLSESELVAFDEWEVKMRVVVKFLDLIDINVRVIR